MTVMATRNCSSWSTDENSATGRHFPRQRWIVFARSGPALHPQAAPIAVKTSTPAIAPKIPPTMPVPVRNFLQPSDHVRSLEPALQQMISVKRQFRTVSGTCRYRHRPKISVAFAW